MNMYFSRRKSEGVPCSRMMALAIIFAEKNRWAVWVLDRGSWGLIKGKCNLIGKGGQNSVKVVREFYPYRVIIKIKRSSTTSTDKPVQNCGGLNVIKNDFLEAYI